MAHVAVNASPFSCLWIERGSEMQIERWSYALCVRIREHPRPVSEFECARCALWQPPNDDNQKGRGSARGNG